jgi:hypothetical protein
MERFSLICMCLCRPWTGDVTHKLDKIYVHMHLHTVRISCKARCTGRQSLPNKPSRICAASSCAYLAARHRCCRRRPRRQQGRRHPRHRRRHRRSACRQHRCLRVLGAEVPHRSSLFPPSYRARRSATSTRRKPLMTCTSSCRCVHKPIGSLLSVWAICPGLHQACGRQFCAHVGARLISIFNRQGTLRTRWQSASFGLERLTRLAASSERVARTKRYDGVCCCRACTQADLTQLDVSSPATALQHVLRTPLLDHQKQVHLYMRSKHARTVSVAITHAYVPRVHASSGMRSFSVSGVLSNVHHHNLLLYHYHHHHHHPHPRPHHHHHHHDHHHRLFQSRRSMLALVLLFLQSSSYQPHIPASF